MPAAARMMCSRCGRCMAVLGLDLPDLGGGKNPGKRRVLAETLSFEGFGAEQIANLRQRTGENGLPFRVATQQRERIGVPPGPTEKIIAGDGKQFRSCAQPVSDAARKLQAYFVNFGVSHAEKLIPPGEMGNEFYWNGF